MEAVVLALDAGVFDHGTGVGLQAGHGAADMGIYLDYLFDGGSLEEGGGYALFDAEEDAMRGGNLVKDRQEGWTTLEEGDVLRTPMAVEPSLIASREYSTWKRRPSGEKVLVRLLASGHLGEVSRKCSYFMPRSAGDISWRTRWRKLAWRVYRILTVQ